MNSSFKKFTGISTWLVRDQIFCETKLYFGLLRRFDHVSTKFIPRWTFLNSFFFLNIDSVYCAVFSVYKFWWRPFTHFYEILHMTWIDKIDFGISEEIFSGSSLYCQIKGNEVYMYHNLHMWLYISLLCLNSNISGKFSIYICKYTSLYEPIE